MQPITLRIPPPRGTDRLIRLNIEHLLEAICCERPRLSSRDPQQAFEALVTLQVLRSLIERFLQEEPHPDLAAPLDTCTACALRGVKGLPPPAEALPPCPWPWGKKYGARVE